MRTLTHYWPRKSASTNLWEDFDHLFEGLAAKNELSSTYSDVSFAPATDITEGDAGYFLSMDLPGLKKEDIKIEINDGTLIVSGERKSSLQETKDKVQRFEKNYGFFKRSFSLPKIADGDRIQAKHENGVLEITIPKAAELKAKKIEIE